MAGDVSGEVPVAFAQGVLDDVAEVTATTAEDDQDRKDEAEALKRRIAELLVECKANPFIGEPMGAGLHPELTDCRRVRFDIPTHKGKPRFRLIYRNQPSDGAPAECLWLTVGPRAGLRAHRKARQRSRGSGSV
jgi:Txe/YoeB family toxin of Txe-Axe toxin-antitoxin module